MKTFVMFGLLMASGLISSANAQVSSTPGAKYREFDVRLNAGCGAESKTVKLEVNADVRVDRHGEPEIEAHGHYDYMVTGSVLESGDRCKFELLLTQDNGEAKSTEEILKSGADRSGSLKLCSGLRLSISSVRALLGDAMVLVGLTTPGLTKPIGNGIMTTTGVKVVPEPTPWDDRH